MSARNAMTEPKISMVETGLIDPFPHQQRRTFDQVKLEEMAASMREHGVLQPMIVRESPDRAGRYELIAGERRLRAARLAELAVVPVIVRELSDLVAEEISLIENLQRENLSPVEEADGIWRMLELRAADGVALYTQESLALKLGKPLNHIKDRVKLRNCPETMLQAVEAGVVGAKLAAIVGRIPDAKARELATKQILKPETQEVPLSTRQAAGLVRSNFMAKITGGLVKPEDATLVPVELDASRQRVRGGACEDCPFRSGNNEDLGDELSDAGTTRGGRAGGSKAGIDPWLCTKPGCLTLKQGAAFARLAEEHLKKSPLNSVLSEATAKKEISPYGDNVVYGSAYVVLSEKPEYRDFQSHEMAQMPWGKLVKGLEVGTALARHPKTGKVLYLLDPAQKERAKALIKGVRKAGDKEAGKGDDKDSASGEQVNAALAKEKASHAKELPAKKVEKLAVEAAMNEVMARVRAGGLGLAGAEALFELLAGDAGADGMGFMGKHWGLEKTGTAGSGRDYEQPVMDRATATATTVNDWLALACFALLSKPVKWSGLNAGHLVTLTEALEIDLERLQVQAGETLDREEGQKASKARAGAVAKVKAKGPPDGMGAGETLSGAPAAAIEAADSGKDSAAAEVVYQEPVTADATPEVVTVATLATGDAWSQQVASLEAEWATLKKPGKAEGEDAKRAWDKERKRISRALAKLGATVSEK